MPQTNRKLTRAVRERRQATGETYTAARAGVLATLDRPETEQRAHALAAAVALRMAHAGEDEATARTSVQEIRETAEANDWTFEQAQVAYDDPRNQVMCHECGWTYGMVCPECPGCGCYNDRCSGWRHHEFAGDDDPDDPHDRIAECEECGGDFNTLTGYGCECNPG